MQGWEVVGIVTVQVEGGDSMMFQIPATKVAGAQAASSGIPWMEVVVSGVENKEIDELELALEPIICGGECPDNSLGRILDWPPWKATSPSALVNTGGRIDALVSGALKSDYQKTRVERMSENLGVRSFTPLWHNNSENHMLELLDNGFEIMLTSVSADGLGEEWIGRTLDYDYLGELIELSKRYSFSPDGEGGEFETTVTNAPHLSFGIDLNGTVIWSGSRGQLSISDVSFRP